MSKLSILVLSCDRNRELLESFFKYFDYYWEDCPYQIYVSMEKCSEINRSDVNILNYYKNDNWGERIIESLKRIDTENVLIILDDFFIEEKVNSKSIEELNQFMLSNSNITNFVLSDTRQENSRSNLVLDNYIERRRFGKYKAVFQMSIWNKDQLISLLHPKENAWEFEIFGNMRSFLTKNKFYSLIDNNNKPISYNDGFLVVQGILNLQEKNRLETKTGIRIKNNFLEESNTEPKRDNTVIYQRVIRRLKIVGYYIITRLKVFLNEQVGLHYDYK